MRKVTTICRLLWAVTIGLPTVVWAEEEPERLFFQAEAMTPTGDAWVVVSHFPNWYTGVPLENMLSGSGGGSGQAVQEFNVPAAGVRRLWVRYIDYTSYRGPFRVTVLQGDVERGNKVFDASSLRADQAGQAKWGAGFGQFVWDSLDVSLTAGPVKMVLSKEEPIGVSWLARKIDCFAWVTDLTYEPKASDFVAPLWVRVTLGQAHPQPSSISIWGRRPYEPVYPPFCQLGPAGLVQNLHYVQPASFLAVGETSPWVNLAPLLTTRGRNNMRFMAMVQYPAPLEGADFELLFASEPSDDAVIKRFQRSGPGGGILVTIDLTKRNEIRSEVSWSRDALAAARSVGNLNGRRARRFPLVTGLSVSAIVNIQETVDNELEILTRLGFSGLSPDPALVERGFVRPYSASFYYHLRGGGVCFSSPQRQAIRNQLTAAAQKLIADGMTNNVAFFDLMDEPSSASLAHLTECEACKETFRVFLRDRENLLPNHFGQQSWEQVAPTADPQEARLYYWTARFRHQVLADFFKLGTDVLRELIPDIRTCANYSEELRYNGNMLSRGADWFLIQNQEALTYGWNEDWCNFAVSSQQSGYHADFLRAACGARKQSFGMYTILGGRTPWDIQTKTVGKIGHGAQAIHYFNYGPTYAITSDQNSHRHEIYPALAKVNHAIGAVEDYILDGHVPTGRVALLYSHSSDIWTQEGASSLHGKERQNVWLLLRHLGYTPEIVTEAQVKAGDLSNYDLVFVHGAHLETGAATALIDWAKAGGTLYLGAGSAMFDHYNQPLNFDTRLGIGRGAFTFSQLPGAQDINHFPSLSVLARAKLGGETLEAVCGIHELTVWDGANVLLGFVNGNPAMVSGPIGTGRVIAAGFFPGLAYARGGVAARANRNEAITYNPPSYPAGCRTLFSAVLGNTAQRAPATTSHYLVEAGLLESPHGLLVTLANWSGLPVTNLEVRIRTAANLAEFAAVRTPIKSITRADGELVLTLDVEEFEFITMPYLVTGTNTWTGSGYTDEWHDGANWSAGVPVAGQEVKINSGSLRLTAATAELASFTLAAGATLTVEGWESALQAQDIVIAGAVTHLPQTVTEPDPVTGEWIPQHRVWLQGSNLTVTANGSINADYAGYTTQAGPGRAIHGASQGGGGGGGYGGVGSSAFDGQMPGPVYGDPADPWQPGSGGGLKGGGDVAAGGAIYLEMQGLVTVDGMITACGRDGNYNYQRPAASGGGIYIRCRAFQGAVGGLVRADGGRGDHGAGCGGGGRIALHYDPSVQAELPQPGVRFSTYAWPKPVTRFADESSWTVRAQMGTLFLTDFALLSETPEGNVVLDEQRFWHTRFVFGNNVMSWSPTSLTISNCVVGFPAGFELNVGSDLLLGGGGGANPLAGTLQGGLHLYAAATNTLYGSRLVVGHDLTIGSNSWIHPHTEGYSSAIVGMRVGRDVFVAAGGGINADEKGYMPQIDNLNAPGAGVHGDSGGSYGGLGGGSAQGASYGLATLPLEAGSPGGWRGRGNYTTSAKGGGAIQLLAGGQMQIDGLLTANGGDGWYYRGAAGSGGSIFLAAMRCSGSGTLQARGGGNPEGSTDARNGTPRAPGGGGRIAIWHHLPLHVVEQRVAEQNVAGLFHFGSCSSFSGVLDTGVTSSILTVQAEEGSKGFYTLGATLLILR